MDPTSDFNHNKPNKQHGGRHHQQASSGELISSAKLVAEAAKAALNHESGKIDKAKAAGAAENLLGAASRYGKLEGKSYGKYVEKAEDYLHKQHQNSSPSTTTTANAAANSGHSAASDGGGHGGNSGSGSGYGEYFKMAQGFLAANSGHSAASGGGGGHGGKSGSGSGYGEYFDMAQGFLKKN